MKGKRHVHTRFLPATIQQTSENSHFTSQHPNLNRNRCSSLQTSSQKPCSSLNPSSPAVEVIDKSVDLVCGKCGSSRGWFNNHSPVCAHVHHNGDVLHHVKAPPLPGIYSHDQLLISEDASFKKI